MLGVKGQWKLIIKINGNELPEDSLDSLLLIEEVNVLPVLQIKLTVKNPKLFESVNNAMSLSLMLTKDLEKEIFSDFLITKNNVTPYSPGVHEINIVAILDIKSYFLGQEIASYEDTSVNTVAAVLMENGLSPEIKHKSNDRQVWLRYNLTAQRFISEVMSHSYKDSNSAFAIGITYDKKAIIANIPEVLKNVPPENLFTSMEGQGIQYNRIQPIRNNFGFFDMVANAGKGYHNFNLVTGLTEKATFTSEKVTANILPSLGNFNRWDTYEFSNDNTHDNYAIAKLTQRANLAKLCNLMTVVELGNNFIPVKLLDGYTIIFPQDDTQYKLNNETYSGKWVVTKVIRQILSNKLFTSVEVNREGINSSGGR